MEGMFRGPAYKMEREDWGEYFRDQHRKIYKERNEGNISRTCIEKFRRKGIEEMFRGPA